MFLIAQALPAPPAEIRRQRTIKIVLTLTDPAQLQVQEGQSLFLGSILAERTDTRRTLEARLEHLKMQQQHLEQAQPPDFLAQARLRELEYQQLQREYDAQYRLVTQVMALPSPPQAIQRQELQKLHSLYNNLQLAHERLKHAYSDAQRQQLNHNLTLNQQKENLKNQIQLLEQEIASTTFRSPIAGTITRIRIIEQKGNEIRVEIQVIPH